jgi:hypothetical protein
MFTGGIIAKMANLKWFFSMNRTLYIILFFFFFTSINDEVGNTYYRFKVRYIDSIVRISTDANISWANDEF